MNPFPRIITRVPSSIPTLLAKRPFSAMTTAQRQKLLVTRTLPLASQERIERGFEG